MSRWQCIVLFAGVLALAWPAEAQSPTLPDVNHYTIAQEVRMGWQTFEELRKNPVVHIIADPIIDRYNARLVASLAAKLVRIYPPPF